MTLWHECGCNTTALSKKLRRPRTTVQHWIESARRENLAPAVASIQPTPSEVALRSTVENLQSEVERLKGALTQATRPRFTVRMDTGARSSKIRLVCVGDAHDSPKLIPDQSRFRRLGQYVRDIKPDVVVQIGDFMDLDSLNAHVPNENYSGKAKPSFLTDIASFNSALEAIDCDGIEKHCTLGNHERRLYLFEERAPEAYGMMQLELQRVFERHKWTFSPYGQITFYGAVGFSHVALNRLGKTFGGINAEMTIANHCLHDMVIGHSHTDRKHRAAKLGPNNDIQVLNTGCFLPTGYVFDYAQHATTGWSYGLTDMTIQAGRIQSASFITMGELEERYP